MKGVQLDIIPIYKNEMFPLKSGWWHFRSEDDAPKEMIIKRMIEQIKYDFFDCNCVIIMENGKVIEILK